MRKLLSVSILIVLAAASSSKSGMSFAEVQASVEVEEYAVYSAVINKMFVDNGAKLVVICDETVAISGDFISDSSGDKFKDAFPGLNSEIVDNYHARNKRAERLKEEFDLPVKYNLVSTESFGKIFTGRDLEANWRAF